VFYYNTHVVNKFRTAEQNRHRTAEYERRYKKYQRLAQPKSRQWTRRWISPTGAPLLRIGTIHLRVHCRDLWLGQPLIFLVAPLVLRGAMPVLFSRPKFIHHMGVVVEHSAARSPSSKNTVAVGVSLAIRGQAAFSRMQRIAQFLVSRTTLQRLRAALPRKSVRDRPEQAPDKMSIPIHVRVCVRRNLAIQIQPISIPY